MEVEREMKNLYFRLLDDMNNLKKQLKEAVTKQEGKSGNEYELGLLNGQISAMDIFNKFLVEELQNVNYDA